MDRSIQSPGIAWKCVSGVPPLRVDHVHDDAFGLIPVATCQTREEGVCVCTSIVGGAEGKLGLTVKLSCSLQGPGEARGQSFAKLLCLCAPRSFFAGHLPRLLRIAARSLTAWLGWAGLTGCLLGSGALGGSRRGGRLVLLELASELLLLLRPFPLAVYVCAFAL